MTTALSTSCVPSPVRDYFLYFGLTPEDIAKLYNSAATPWPPADKPSSGKPSPGG